MFSKKAMSGVIVVSLLFLASISFYFVSSQWFDDFSFDLKQSFESPYLEEVLEVKKIDGENLYISNSYDKNFTLNSIKIGGNICNISNLEVSSNSNVINISNCTYGLNEFKPYEVSIVSSLGTLQNYEMIREPFGNSGGSSQSSNFISNSLLFDGVNDYLSWTPSQEGNRTIWTWSGWVKKTKFEVAQYLFSTGGINDYEILGFNTDDSLYYICKPSGVVQGAYSSLHLSKDPSEFKHVLFVRNLDSFEIYLDGAKLSLTENKAMTSSLGNINNNAIHNLGRYTVDSAKFFNGYMSEVNFIDGQALTPNNFGQFNDYGKWIPKQYEGTYGQNGFHLTFENSSNLGQDYSGNDNDWTVSGSPVQTIDTPENNFATLNPLYKLDGGFFSKGNLNWISDNTYYSSELASISMVSGKWWVRSTLISSTGTPLIGIVKLDGINRMYRLGNNAGELMYRSVDGQIRLDGTSIPYGITWNNPNNIIDTYLDLDNKKITFFINSVSQGEFDISSWWNNEPLVFAISDSTSSGQIELDLEFGATLNSPNSSFKTLSSKNLPAPTVIPSQGFDVLTYNGTGSSQNIDSLNFKPDLVWIKNRDQADSHKLFDILRGPTKYIESNTNIAQVTDTNSLTSFNLDGFTLGTGANGFNDLNEKFVAWNWKEGPEYGFDIVNYTGNGMNQNIISHNLGKIPELMLIKNYDYGSDVNWYVRANQLNQRLVFSDNLAGMVDPYLGIINESSFEIIDNGQPLNTNAYNQIAYLFTSISGFSKIGSYTGNGNVDGPFIYTGFKPRYLMIKSIDNAGGWSIFDSKRFSLNPNYSPLYGNYNNEDGSSALSLDLLSNGFKIRETSSWANSNGNEYIYIAFADYPLSTNY